MTVRVACLPPPEISGHSYELTMLWSVVCLLDVSSAHAFYQSCVLVLLFYVSVLPIMFPGASVLRFSFLLQLVDLHVCFGKYHLLGQDIHEVQVLHFVPDGSHNNPSSLQLDAGHRARHGHTSFGQSLVGRRIKLSSCGQPA
eukprot:1185748-Prorocentrum_minimum.AAC.1